MPLQQAEAESFEGLVKPNYIEMNRLGMIKAIYCKVCGKPIAATRRGRLRLLPNYAQLKMEFPGGNYHTTPIGRECMTTVADNKTLMDAVFRADIAQFERELPGNSAWTLLRKRVNPRFAGAEIRKVPLP